MDFEVMKAYLPRFWDALLLTLRIGWQGVALALALGVACAVAVHWKIPVLRQIVGWYIELFRNTPLLVQLFFLYFALPKIGVRISAETCGKLGLGLLGGAYMAETFRSGLSAISLMDLMFTAKDLIGMYAKTIECLTLLVIFYLIMLLPVSILGSWLERRLRYAEFGN